MEEPELEHPFPDPHFTFIAIWARVGGDPQCRERSDLRDQID
jgi:hypothetical protein